MATEETSGPQCQQRPATKITTRAGHRVVVGDGNWYNDDNHDDENGKCYEEKDHDDDRQKGGGGGGVKNRASVCGGRGNGRGRQQSTKNSKTVVVAIAVRGARQEERSGVSMQIRK